MEIEPDENSHPFGDPIYSYTRKQALADGMQVDVSETAREAGIRFPTFITRTVYDGYVAVPPGVAGQDEAGRLWDVIWMLRMAIQKTAPGQDRIRFKLYVRNDNRRPRLVELLAACGPMDIDDPVPAITVMTREDD